MTYLTNNFNHLLLILQFHNISTKSRLWLYRPVANLTSYQKGVHYESIKTFNALPVSTAERLTNNKKFTTALKNFLMDKSLLY